MRCVSSRSADPRRRAPAGPRARTALPGLLALAVLAAFVPVAARAQSGVSGRDADRFPAPPGTRLVVAPEGLADPVSELERHGFRVAVALPPRLYYVLPARAPRLLPAGFAASPTPEATSQVAPPASSVPPLESTGDPFGGRVDVLPPQRVDVPSLSGGRAAGSFGRGLFHGTGWAYTSEFMLGRVAVSILFPESDGGLDPDRYDWTPELQDSVVRSCIAGFARWSVRAAAHGLPLLFVLETRPGLRTRYEPIDRTVAEEALWIGDVLAPLVGRGNDAMGLAYEYANDLRARHGTEWAVLVFGVQNATDPDGAFPDGYIAHSVLGGPFIVLPVNNLNSPSARLDYYAEHEMTHMFWALDEYPAANAWWTCWYTTGYFAYSNANSSVPVAGYCCGGCHYTCLMGGNYPGVSCPYTEGQIGWADLDHSGTINLLETRPGVQPDSIRYHGSAGLPVAVGGTATEVALPNLNPNPPRVGAGEPISVAVIDSVQMRVDQGSWVSVPPADGLYDSGQERFLASVGPLTAGNHLVEWVAWNSSGRPTETPASAVVEVGPGAGAADAGGEVAIGAAPWLRVGPSPGRGPFVWSLRARAGAPLVVRLVDVQGRTVRLESHRMPPGGRLEGLLAARGEGGRELPGGLYFLVVDTGSERLSRRVVLLH